MCDGIVLMTSIYSSNRSDADYLFVFAIFTGGILSPCFNLRFLVFFFFLNLQVPYISGTCVSEVIHRCFSCLSVS